MTPRPPNWSNTGPVPRRPTRPEGVEYTPTPTPVLVDSPAPAWTGWRPVVTAVSIVVGIVIGVGAIVGGLGRAFYVERAEYTQKVLRDAEDRVNSQETLKQIRAAMDRQEAELARLSEAAQTARDALRELKVGSARGRR